MKTYKCKMIPCSSPNDDGTWVELKTQRNLSKVKSWKMVPRLLEMMDHFCCEVREVK